MGGSFSAILLKIPGTPSASATALDGYPLASSGRAHIALSTAIISSFLGGLFSFICLYFIAPELAEVALSFRAPDLFSLVFFGLSVICSFATKSIIKGLLSGIIGLLFVSIGQDPVMGTERFTFGNPDLLSGIHFLTALIGLFAIPQLADNLRESTKNFNHDRKNSKIKGLLPSLKNLKIMRLPILIGSFLGTFIGILPGAGGPIAAFISYDYTKKINKNPKKFGEGCIEGVAAPESANNAVCGGALIPMMTLGIPGDPVTAILIGALLVHGLAPGPLLFMEQAPFAYSVIFSFFWANLFNLLIAMSTLPLLIKLLKTSSYSFSISYSCILPSCLTRNKILSSETLNR